MSKNNKVKITVTDDTDDKLLKSVVDGIDYVFTKDVLVKPMPIEKVKKEITKPIPTGKKGVDGFEEYETVTSEEDVECMFRKGVVLKMPMSVTETENKPVYGYEVGDTIVFHTRSAVYFDLFKDSMLIKPYDVVAKIIKK